MNNINTINRIYRTFGSTSILTFSRFGLRLNQRSRFFSQSSTYNTSYNLNLNSTPNNLIFDRKGNSVLLLPPISPYISFIKD